MVLQDPGQTATSSSQAVAKAVAVVSFDLDDTIWPTNVIIGNANRKLDDHLQANYPDLHSRVNIPQLMKEVWKEEIASRSAAENRRLGTSPIDLTKLRRGALRKAAEQCGVDPGEFVDPCFKLWLDERHNVEDHIFPDVLETLRVLKERGLRLCAITNGNAGTDNIACLRDLFEFCINAEKVGLRKPHAAVFEAAVKRAGFSSLADVPGTWVHVGDDATSDCLGAKAAGMRTVLIRPPGVAPGVDEYGQQQPREGAVPDVKIQVAHPPSGPIQDERAVHAEQEPTAQQAKPDGVDHECGKFSELPDLIEQWSMGG